MTKATSHLSSTLGPLFTIVIGAVLILVAVHYLGKLLKLLTVGNACSGEGDQHRIGNGRGLGKEGHPYA